MIARKISFGSQSEAGAKTRETLMTVLHTLRKRVPDVATAFQAALDQLTEQPDADPAKILFGLDSSCTPFPLPITDRLLSGIFFF